MIHNLPFGKLLLSKFPHLKTGPPFLMVWFNGMFYCGIQLYKLSLLKGVNKIRNIYEGTVVLYHCCQVKPDISDMFNMSHILPQVLGTD